VVKTEANQGNEKAGSSNSRIAGELMAGDFWRLKIRDVQGIFSVKRLKQGSMLTSQIELPMEKIADFCRRWGVARLEIFGSALRDDFGPHSDVDFMFTPGPGFQRDKAYGPWGRDYMAEELASMLGREVDLIERNRIERMDNWIKRRHILQTAASVYVD
jgi:predicted nucleotidyltransferase